jgi:hypothetical protein
LRKESPCSPIELIIRVLSRIFLEFEKKPVSAKEPGLSGKIRTPSAMSAITVSNLREIYEFSTTGDKTILQGVFG